MTEDTPSNRRRIRVGLTVTAGMLVLAAAVIWVPTRDILVPKYHLQMYVRDASGLAVGNEVRIDGFDVGRVGAVRFGPRRPDGTTDPARNFEVTLQLDKRYAQEIRKDSAAFLSSAGLLGAPVVEITRGTEGTPLANGTELPFRETPKFDFIALIEKLADNVNCASVKANETKNKDQSH